MDEHMKKIRDLANKLDLEIEETANTVVESVRHCKISVTCIFSVGEQFEEIDFELFYKDIQAEDGGNEITFEEIRIGFDKDGGYDSSCVAEAIIEEIKPKFPQATKEQLDKAAEEIDTFVDNLCEEKYIER